MGLLWLLLIGFAVYLLYLNMNKSPYQVQGGGLDVPLEILKKRYARGEITHEQFEEIKKDLQ
jgi:putative membrane protein